MEKSDLENIPDLPLPEGYALRTYREGDEGGIGRVYEAAGLGNTTAEEVRLKMIEDLCFTPGRLFVVERDGQLVGTAAAWRHAQDPDAGYLHMVGLLPEHRGKGLGALLVVSAIRYTRQEGFRAQRLDTDDWREPALRLYLDLGYYPLCVDETHPARWQLLAARLNRPEILMRVRQGTLLPPEATVG